MWFKELKYLCKYICNINEIELGRYIRWINPKTMTLTSGGIICKIKNNTIIVKNSSHRFTSCNNSHIIFQKLTDQERILLEIVSIL